MIDDRGQAFTLEGVTAGILMLLVLFLAMQSIVITPTTEGSVGRDITSQLATEANDVLAAAHEDDDLVEAALAWDPDADGPNGKGDWNVSSCQESNELGLCTKLNETFSTRYYRYNVYVETPEMDEPKPLPGNRGTPGDRSATVTHSVAIYEEMELSDDDRTVADVEDSFYAENMSDDNLYTIVEIRVVVW